MQGQDLGSRWRCRVVGRATDYTEFENEEARNQEGVRVDLVQTALSTPELDELPPKLVRGRNARKSVVGYSSSDSFISGIAPFEMNWWTKLCILIGWTRITKTQVTRWIRERNIGLLHFTLSHGYYTERIQAIQGIVRLHGRHLIPQLLSVVRSDMDIVALEAIHAVETLDASRKYTTQVLNFKAYLHHRQNTPPAPPKKPVYKWPDKKERMKNLERLREQLKNPRGRLM